MRGCTNSGAEQYVEKNIFTKHNSSSCCFSFSCTENYLIEFFSSRWIDTGVSSIFLFLLQDLILSVIIYLAATAVLSKDKRYFYLLSILSGGLLLCLIVDMRVRELWLKPMDFALIKYSLQNSSNLISGIEIFLNQSSGFG